MRILLTSALLLTTFAAARTASAQTMSTTEMVAMYKDLHAHPELSHHEERTSAILAKGLRAAGYTVTEHVGVYADGSKAFGVVGVLKNGSGPTVLVRGDMDALPVTEETGVPYASKVTAITATGATTGVMQACGHDIHTTVLLATAQNMVQEKSKWHGTLIVLGQPSEETIDGAKAMLADHLYERFGTPNRIVGLHDTNLLPAGSVGVPSGPAMASSQTVNVTIRGIGGHGSMPNLGKDPIVIAAAFIQQIQTIVSRQEDPRDPAVVTVGSIHGGTKANIISNEVKLELTTRGFSDRTREIILTGIRNAARGVAIAAGLPEDLYPIVTVLPNESTSVNFNDEAQAARVKAALATTLGAANVTDYRAIMGSEDFGLLGLATTPHIPTTFFWLGAMYPDRFAAAQAKGELLPGMHTTRFEPDPEPTLHTGAIALTAATLELLKP
jgi:amidohydrolase